MGKLTYIQWCDRTWSPWLGCRKVSPGCDNCYIVRTPALSFRGIKHGSQREDLSEAYWALPERWNRAAVRNPIYRCPACNRVGTVNTVCPTESCTTFASEMAIVRPRVFPSLCDPFDAEVPLDWRLAFFDTIKSTPNLDWLLLTKRPENALKFYEEHVWRHSDGRTLPPDRRADFTLKFLPNVWLGVSVEDQQRADERIPILLRISARVRFLSVEPMLEHIDLATWFWSAMTPLKKCAVDWVIFGGESGPNARQCSLDWIDDGLRQCRAAGVPVFVKQFGAFPTCSNVNRWDFPGHVEMQESCCVEGAAAAALKFHDKKGGDMAEWPEEFQVREFPR